MLPQGLDTLGNYLMNVISGDTIVGYLWFLTEEFEGVKAGLSLRFPH